MNNRNRIIKNTLMLYSRQILILLVGLYTVRVVLDVLGVEDYGVYSVVGGVVAMFSFLSSTMSSATQRYFSYALGKSDDELLKKTFSVNFLIYCIIGIVAFLLLKTIGLWFVTNHLNVPVERVDATLWVFRFSVLSFIATIFTTPFVAILIAHEDMHVYAYVSIVEAIVRLVVVVLLYKLPGDNLENYAVLLFVASSLNAFLYITICLLKYKECQIRYFYWDKELVKEILGFTGWTLMGQVTTVARIQAVTILLNQFFNPVTVASRAIATNIASKINLFSSNFNLGLYPPIIKSYAANDKKEMFLLVFNGSKIAFFLMWVFALPLFIEMDVVLEIWLKEPPSEAVLFTRLALVEALIVSIGLPMGTAARAPGRMKVYEITLGTLQIVLFIVAWIILMLGGAAHTVYIVAILMSFIMYVVRLFIVRYLIGFPILEFCKSVVVKILFVCIVSTMSSYLIYSIMPKSIIFTIIKITIMILISVISMYVFGLDYSNRMKIREIVTKKIDLILKR